jgi:hypothetical protein
VTVDRNERQTRLDIDVDTRLAELWALALDRETVIGAAMAVDLDMAHSIGLLLRAAYGLGYCDALQEDREGRRGELARANGYRAL